jgi:NADH dehydrogenase [ubiquinone] 1 alpha subcomplex assembly factor 7
LIRRPVPNFPDPTDAAKGAVVEVSPDVDAFVAKVAAAAARYNGAALFIDYGHAHSGMGETLQAVKDHQFADVLAAPGDVDLTAHVDFQRVAQIAAANGAKAHGPVEQGAWLTQLGVQLRAARLTAGKSPEVAAEIDAGVARLVNADAMGRLFKVIALTAPEAATPEGFA